MAGFVVGPWQVDPALTQAGAAPAKVIERRNEIVAGGLAGDAGQVSSAAAGRRLRQ